MLLSLTVRERESPTCVVVKQKHLQKALAVCRFLEEMVATLILAVAAELALASFDKMDGFCVP